MNLDDLTEDLSGLSREDAIAHTREIYESVYLNGKNANDLPCHDGEKVIFYRDRFEHAFFTGGSTWGPAGDKSRLCPDRASKIRWIATVITCGVDRSECWLIENDRHGRPPKRLYICRPKSYVIWLEPTKHERTWKFSSAFSMTPEKIRDRCRMGRKIWPETKKPRD